MKSIRAILIVIISLLLIPSHSIANDGWQLIAHRYSPYYGITLGTGRIGVVSDTLIGRTNDIILNNVYDKVGESGISRIVRAPRFMQMSFSVNGERLMMPKEGQWEQIFDMRKACLQTRATWQRATVTCRQRALRQLPFMMLTEVEVIAHENINFSVEQQSDIPEELQQRSCQYRVLRHGEVVMPILVTHTQTKVEHHRIATAAAFLFNREKLPIKSVGAAGKESQTFTTHIAAGDTLHFSLIGAVCTDVDFKTPENDVERLVGYALQQPLQHLIAAHESRWQQLWRGDIRIQGCLSDQLAVRSALYHLYAFQRAGSRTSIPPFGLSNALQAYNGHIFWDAELWMYPPLLYMHPQLARGCIDFRTIHMQEALIRADALGYQGAMYPWETDSSGEEATPTWCLTGMFEQHVTADVGIAFWNYYCATHDISWLKTEGFDVISAIAKFWVSRVSWNKDGSCSIRRVIGADEYTGVCDDNAFTNAAVRQVLQAAISASAIVGKKVPKQWGKVAKKLRIVRMHDGTIAEYEGYQGQPIKQADVNLLAYPLSEVRDRTQILRDLRYYTPRIVKEAPAMAHSILAILYCKLGNIEKAYEHFKLSFVPNERPPFGVLSESATTDNPYFVTGAGGMLQAVLFGFAGIELTENGYVQHSIPLPKAWSGLEVSRPEELQKCQEKE